MLKEARNSPMQRDGLNAFVGLKRALIVIGQPQQSSTQTYGNSSSPEAMNLYAFGASIMQLIARRRIHSQSWASPLSEGYVCPLPSPKRRPSERATQAVIELLVSSKPTLMPAS